MNLIKTAVSIALDCNVDAEQSLAEYHSVKVLNAVGSTQGKCMLGKAMVHHFSCLPLCSCTVKMSRIFC